jgi:threonyl-tRNA synthetase
MEDSSSPSLALLNQTAAILLAVATVELFPGVLLAGGGGTDKYFFYDFVFPFEFQESFIPQIEEYMRLIIRQKREVKRLEMMPANAASLMQHRSQSLAAEFLLRVERATVDLCQIGGCAVYSSAPFLDALTLPQLKIFEVFAWEKGMRIVGAAALEKSVLKARAKEPSVSSRSHLTIAKESKLFEPCGEEGLWSWLPQGEALRQRLVALWQQEHVRQNFSFVSSPTAWTGGERGLTEAHSKLFTRLAATKIAEIALVSNAENADLGLGLLSPAAHFVDRAHLFCSEDELLGECISSLQFIVNILKILGFEYETVLSVSSEASQKLRSQSVVVLQRALEAVHLPYTLEKGCSSGMLATVDVRIADALGRRWTGPFLGVSEGAQSLEKGWVLVRSAFGSLERIVALLLERREGRLPLFLVPEQVRILVATDKTNLYADQVNASLRAQGIRAVVEGCMAPLKARLYKAFVEKVPFVILLGEREEKAKVLTVRVRGESEERILSVSEFCVGLKCEMESKTSEFTN